ncbi:MAG: ATP-binding cassette domain-containing protein [Coriobacteriales bacterium]|jgi:peptide/nickel transport system ATP-binding protein|nr:ATP-binding cassette domain-containing protein [Coriobacteriales bacterium]
MLEARALSFGYGSKLLFKDCSLSVERGERVAVQAPSGFGKTTLCRILAGYTQPDEGKVLVDGRALPRKGRCPVQMIMQHPETVVDPRLRMQDVLEEAGEVSGALLESFQVDPRWLDRFAHELSGGELQRICLVRALATNPRYLIADELSTMLDAVTQASVWHALLKEAESRNLGMVIVTHATPLARRVATRVVDLYGAPATLERA